MKKSSSIKAPANWHRFKEWAAKRDIDKNSLVELWDNTPLLEGIPHERRCDVAQALEFQRRTNEGILDDDFFRMLSIPIVRHLMEMEEIVSMTNRFRAITGLESLGALKIRTGCKLNPDCGDSLQRLENYRQQTADAAEVIKALIKRLLLRNEQASLNFLGLSVDENKEIVMHYEWLTK